MTDIVDQATRSRMMGSIRGKDTKPEMLLRRSLHAKGFRYRLHVPGLPGRPDLVFPKHNAVVFVHGCFWHRHKACRYTTTPSTRSEFWREKFEANMQRDIDAQAALLQAGWRVAIVWECALKSSIAEKLVAELESWLREDTGGFLEIGEPTASGNEATSSKP